MTDSCLCTPRLVSFFKAGCDEHRQRILAVVRKHKRINAHNILKYLDISQPTLSHHLKILKEANLLRAEKEGKEVFFSLHQENITDCCNDFMKELTPSSTAVSKKNSSHHQKK